MNMQQAYLEVTIHHLALSTVELEWMLSKICYEINKIGV